LGAQTSGLLFSIILFALECSAEIVILNTTETQIKQRNTEFQSNAPM